MVPGPERCGLVLYSVHQGSVYPERGLCVSPSWIHDYLLHHNDSASTSAREGAIRDQAYFHCIVRELKGDMKWWVALHSQVVERQTQDVSLELTDVDMLSGLEV